MFFACTILNINDFAAWTDEHGDRCMISHEHSKRRTSVTDRSSRKGRIRPGTEEAIFQEALNGLFLIRDGDSQHDQFVGMVVCVCFTSGISRRDPEHQLPQKFSRTHDSLFTEATWTAFPPVPAKVKSGARSSE